VSWGSDEPKPSRINTAEDVAKAVVGSRYPPVGARSLGPTRSGLRIGPAPAEANALAAGLHTRSGEEAAKRASEGFTLLTMASDINHLEAAAAAHLATVDLVRSDTTTT
jgi:2-keto-3-deoxy-L-rhamnonate aldolase RhmA